MIDNILEKHNRIKKVLRLEKPDRLPMGDIGFVEYNKEIYNRGEPELILSAGEVGVSNDGKKKFTADGGVWATGAAEEFYNYENVLKVDPMSFIVEKTDKHMLDKMHKMFIEKNKSCFTVPWHYGTLVSRATIEFGWNGFLMAAALEPEQFSRILDRFGEASLAVAKGWAMLDETELIIIHDDIAATRGLIMSPDWLRTYIFPWHKKIFKAIHERGKKVLYISDGNYLEVLDDILDNEPDGLYVESSSMKPVDLMHRAGSDKLYLVKTDSRLTDYGTKEQIKEELANLRRLHTEFPGMMIYMGGGSVNKENKDTFEKYYNEILVY